MFGDCGSPDDGLVDLLGREYECPYRVLWNTIGEDSPIAVCVVSLSGHWLVPHPRIAQWLGYTVKELQGMTFQDITHPDDLDADLAQVQLLIRREKRYYQMEKRYLSKAGHPIWVRLSVTALPSNDKKRVIGFLSQIENISDRKAQEGQLRELLLREREMAETDPLTGLYNRRRFDSELERYWRINRRKSIPFGLILIDVDRFKSINDRSGHCCGDAVLKAIAHTLQLSVRVEDYSIRFAGDEFAVLMPDTNEIDSTVERLEKALQGSIDWYGETIHYSCSVGGAVCAKLMRSTDDLYRLADDCMMARKAAKKMRSQSANHR